MACCPGGPTMDGGWAGDTASYIDAEFTRMDATSSSHIVGDPVEMVPEYSASVWVDYRFDWTAAVEIPASLAWTSISRGSRTSGTDRSQTTTTAHLMSSVCSMLVSAGVTVAGTPKLRAEHLERERIRCERIHRESRDASLAEELRHPRRCRFRVTHDAPSTSGGA